jgi:membrane protein implicated in regulation of membrane protease activity
VEKVAAIVWAVVAAVAIGIEIFTLDLIFAFVAVGAVAGAGVALLGAPLWTSILTVVVVAFAGILLVRPAALRHLHKQARGSRTGVDAIPGTEGVALTGVTRDSGLIKLRGEDWTARLDSAVTIEPIGEGTRVVVTRIDGATALVHPID